MAMKDARKLDEDFKVGAVRIVRKSGKPMEVSDGLCKT